MSFREVFTQACYALHMSILFSSHLDVTRYMNDRS